MAILKPQISKITRMTEAKAVGLPQTLLLTDNWHWHFLPRIPEDGAKMAGGSCDHKQMPNEVVVGQSFRCVEEDSQGVGDASAQNPEQSRKLDVKPEEANGEQCQPSHS